MFEQVMKAVLAQPLVDDLEQRQRLDIGPGVPLTLSSIEMQGAYPDTSLVAVLVDDCEPRHRYAFKARVWTQERRTQTPEQAAAYFLILVSEALDHDIQHPPDAGESVTELLA
jgi:hypothetical protein